MMWWVRKAPATLRRQVETTCSRGGLNRHALDWRGRRTNHERTCVSRRRRVQPYSKAATGRRVKLSDLVRQGIGAPEDTLPLLSVPAAGANAKVEIGSDSFRFKLLDHGVENLFGRLQLRPRNRCIQLRRNKFFMDCLLRLPELPVIDPPGNQHRKERNNGE